MLRQGNFVNDLNEIRLRARQHIEDGPVTAGYTANRKVVLKLLNEALATELICVLRYRRHFYMAKGIVAESVASEFLQHSQEEQQHADSIAGRIVQLNGEPNFCPDGLSKRASSEYVEGTDLIDMIKEDLVAERIAIDTYKNMIEYLGTTDPTTRRLLEDILKNEEEHANDMADLTAKIEIKADRLAS